MARFAYYALLALIVAVLMLLILAVAFAAGMIAHQLGLTPFVQGGIVVFVAIHLPKLLKAWVEGARPARERDGQ